MTKTSDDISGLSAPEAYELGRTDAQKVIIARFRKWQEKVGPNELVPWQVMFISDRLPTEKEVAFGRELAKKLGLE